LTRYTVIIAEDAQRELRRLDRSVARRIVAAIEDLAEDPLRKLRRLVNSPLYRLRVGDWRVIVEVDEREVRVIAIKVAHRRSIYR
jgi:mRNA interferase RelE/StbE